MTFIILNGRRINNDGDKQHVQNDLDKLVK